MANLIACTSDSGTSFIAFGYALRIGNTFLNLTMSNVNINYATVSSNILTFIRTCKIRILYTRSSGVYAASAYINIVKNGVSILTNSGSVDGGTYSVDVNITAGDTLYIQVRASATDQAGLSSVGILTI